MNQTEIIDRILNDLKASGVPISRCQVEAVVMNLAETTAKTLAKGEEVLLPRLGKLHTVPRKARRVSHPKNGEAIELPARTAVLFRPLKGLRDAINNPGSTPDEK